MSDDRCPHGLSRRQRCFSCDDATLAQLRADLAAMTARAERAEAQLATDADFYRVERAAWEGPRSRAAGEGGEVKNYPKVTRWTVALPAGAWPSAKYPETDMARCKADRYEETNRYGALACLNHWRARSATPDELRLVVIRPRVDHKAEAERLRAAMVYVREAIKNQLAHNEKKGTTKSTAEHLAVIDGMLNIALTPPDPARKETP